MLMEREEFKFHTLLYCCYYPIIHSFSWLRKLSETNKMTSMHSSGKTYAVENSFNNQHICVTAPFSELSEVNKQAQLFGISLQ